MTPEERARKIVRDLFYDTEWDNLVSYGAEAIATALREARNAALEEAAGVADEYFHTETAHTIAARILALKDKQE